MTDWLAQNWDAIAGGALAVIIVRTFEGIRARRRRAKREREYAARDAAREAELTERRRAQARELREYLSAKHERGEL